MRTLGAIAKAIPTNSARGRKLRRAGNAPRVMDAIATLAARKGTAFHGPDLNIIRGFCQENPAVRRVPVRVAGDA
ncbi:hypothetical protein UC8_32200 [Roseimaritima ulvae]|uniref:Uncharacterized protein n=1 Tax=Roseimaritima ulvae TaxID=980254 RepID=A0A5B9R465_9BACT|nr:hypothetical protein UC8_32200 [Roseimaritima ulvae]